MKAEEVVSRARDEVRDAGEALRRHPYLASLSNREVPVAALKAFPGHEHHMVISDGWSVAMLVERYGGTSHSGFFNRILQGELAAVEGIDRLARKLGMTADELDRYPLRPGGFAYSAYVCHLAVQGSGAEYACGLLVNFAVWGANCGAMSAALRENYGFTKDDTVFLDAFAAMPSFEAEALAIVQDGLDKGVGADRIVRAARLIQGYEAMFWDTMAEIASELAGQA